MDRPNAAGPKETSPDQENPAAGAGSKRLRIVTRCSTLEEFFITFGPFADEASLFIVTNKPRALGLVQPFVIQLKDGATIMRGEVEVIQSTTDGAGPEGRNGMRLKFLQPDDPTRDILRRLLEHAHIKRSLMPPPPSATSPSAVSSEGRAAAPSVTDTKLSPSPAREPLAKPELPKASPSGPSSTTQISPPTEAPAVKAPSVAVLRPQAEDSVRAVSDLGPEERVPGAAYQLPANPFEGITAEALESFVECTLYEERMPRADEPPIETSVIFAMPAQPGSVYPPPAPLSVGGHPLELPPGVPPPPPATAGHNLPAPPTFAAPSPPTFGPAPPSPSNPGPPPPGVVRDAVLLAAAIQAASVPATRPKRTWIIAATAAISSVASLAAAYWLWGKPQDLPPVPTSTQTVSLPPPTVPEKTAAPVPSAAPTASVVPTSTLPRECRANVRSYPDGASILWNGEPIGPTPLADTPVPCGPARVTFQLRGFETGERSTGAIIGKPAGVFLRLTPARVPVDVTSTPAGAQILLEGRPMGRTPATITMVGPKESKLLLRLTGYKVWTTGVVPEPPRVTIHADLEKK